MTTFRTIESPCPVCDHPVTIHQITSTNTFGGQDTDFRSHAVGFDPVHIMIASCTNCGYSDINNHFYKPRTLSDEIKQRIHDTLTPLAEDEVRPDIAYRHAAQIAIWRGAPNEEIASLYLRAAWCAADNDNTEDEIASRKVAVAYFERALENDEIIGLQRPSITYLIGELHRRIGETELASEWFEKVLAMDDLDERLAWLKPAAQQQRDDPKERFR